MPNHDYPDRSHDVPAEAGEWIPASMVITAAIFVLVVAVVFGALVLLL